MPSRPAGSPATPRPFSLQRWYAGLSLVVIALIGVVASLTLSRYLTETMVRRDGVVTMELIEGMLGATPLSDAFDPSAPDAAGPTSGLLRGVLRHIAALPDVVRVNVFGDDGRMVWSSSAVLLGQDFAANPELDEALAGHLVYEWGTIGTDDKAEHIAFPGDLGGQRFVEYYVPLRATPNGPVAGVIELYRLPSALFAAIDQGRLWIGLLTLGGGGFLFLCLFWAVRRADRIMRDQHRRLVEAETAVVLGEVASAVAHSTRNAVAVIRSSAELALDEDVEGTRRCARAIVAEADRLDRWVRDLLTYANTDELDPGRVDVNTVVEDVIAGNRPRLDDRGVRLDLALAPGLPAAHVGVVPLGQVLATVIGNALDAMPGGGTLRVTTAMTPAGDGIAVTVRDSGEGMDPATLAQAFRPFFTTKRRGTGLGLALARRIATRFGGLITLDSTPGAGTTARLVLRRAV